MLAALHDRPTVYIEQAERSSATKVPGGDRVQYDMDNMDSQWLARLHSLDVKGEVPQYLLSACLLSMAPFFVILLIVKDAWIWQ